MNRSVFVVKDCSLVSLSAGRSAQNLKELRDGLYEVHPSAVYNHMLGGLLRPGFDDPEYNNDFAAWAAHALNDKRLAERLGMIDPAEFRTLDDLRRELIDVIEDRLDESEHIPWAKADQKFHFTRCQLIIFDTGQRLQQPQDLSRQMPRLSLGSVFFHFIDARWRSPDGLDDFRGWMKEFSTECQPLVERLAHVDPYFISLSELRQSLSLLFQEFFGSQSP